MIFIIIGKCSVKKGILASAICEKSDDLAYILSGKANLNNELR